MGYLQIAFLVLFAIVGYSRCSERFKGMEEQYFFTLGFEKKIQKASVPAHCELVSDSKCRLSAVIHTETTKKPKEIDTTKKHEEIDTTKTSEDTDPQDQDPEDTDPRDQDPEDTDPQDQDPEDLNQDSKEDQEQLNYEF